MTTTARKLRRLAALYADVLRAYGAVAIELPEPDKLINPDVPPQRQQMIDHALWAAMNIPNVVHRLGGEHHCIRWIGRIEGLCAAYGLMTLRRAREIMDVQIHPIMDEYTELRKEEEGD